MPLKPSAPGDKPHPGYAAGREPIDPATGEPPTVGQSVQELQSYVSFYISTYVDRAKVIVRNVIVFGALGAVAAVAGVTIVVTAAVLLMLGIADGLGHLFGGYMWIGDLVTAVLVFGALALGALLVAKRLTKSSRKTLVQSYEDRKRNQRRAYGTDVHERAGE